jgi:DUF3073 family protein
MGRGRAKAKQTKVARELKYSSGGTDLDRLRAELVSGGGAPVEDEAEEEDPYAKYAQPDDTERRSG